MPRATARRTTKPTRLVPLAEASEYAHVCVRTMSRYISQGLITGYRLGPRLVRVDLDEIDELISPIITLRTIA